MDLWIYESMEKRNYGVTEQGCIAAELRKYGITDLRNHGVTESRNNGITNLLTMEENRTKSYNRKQKSGNPNFRKSVDSEVRKFEGELRPLMSEAEKSEAQVLDLSYDFACRIIRLYKYLNEGKLNKADRDIVDALGRQLLRSATSINANVNEAQHPQSDADFLSKATIALKESRESETWLHMLSDNGYLDQRMSESILHDCARINKILITITAKVRKRLNA